MRRENIPISARILLDKAFSLVIQLETDFTPNVIWIDWFKKRENITFQIIHREEKEADKTAAHAWLAKVLPCALTNFCANDDSELFYNPQKKNEQKLQVNKERLMFLASVNKSGTEKEIHTLKHLLTPVVFVTEYRVLEELYYFKSSYAQPRLFFIDHKHNCELLLRGVDIDYRIPCSGVFAENEICKEVRR